MARQADRAVFLEDDDVKAPKRKITRHAAAGRASARNYDVVRSVGHVPPVDLGRSTPDSH